VQLDLLVDDLFAREADILEELRCPSPITFGVDHDLRITSRVEQHEALGMLDEEARDRNVEDYIPPAHHQLRLHHADRGAGEGNEFIGRGEAHRRLLLMAP
jgi:hypothetical protein